MDISKLNKNQLQAVTHDQGPAILVAGAGTGKTTVITHRIGWLIEQGKAQADQIVALTFTDKAAAEMEERVDKLLPLGYVDTWIQTFHSFADKLLRLHGLDIGLPIDYKVLDQTATWMLIRENIDQFNLDYYRPLGNPTKFIHALISHFSRCKDEGIYPTDYVKYAEGLKLDTDQTGDKKALEQEIVRINELADAYHIYQNLLLENSVLDFGDLINYCLKLFKDRPKLLAQYQQQFKYVLIDEFQDTNWAQYELIKLLLGTEKNIMVVGDDDQSIYKFRGASVSNILAFKQEFPKAVEIYLTDNYRSGQKILDTAYQFIQLNNPDRLEVKLNQGKKSLSKKLISHTDNPGEIQTLKFATGEDEIRGVVEQILELKRQNGKDPSPRLAGLGNTGIKEMPEPFDWGQVAILSRSNDEAQRFVRLLRAVGLPHQFVASKGLYTQEIILVILNYLKLLDNYHESTALYKILTLPLFTLTHQDVVNLSHLASRRSWSLFTACKQWVGNAEISPAGVQSIDKILRLIEAHRSLAQNKPVSAVVYQFLEDSGYLEMLTLEDNADNREQLAYLNQFYKKIRAWEDEHLGHSLHDFVGFMNLELESGEAGAMSQNIEEGPETIKVMTIHGAKGLEFNYVFIVGMVHLRFPSIERKDAILLPTELVKETLPEGDSHLQEERRLMYVALTRAKKNVWLTYADDYGGAKKRKPSRFLAELNLLPEITVSVNQDLVVPEVEKPLQATSYKLPARLSFTQLKAFENCPYQYYYAHVIKIPSRGKAVFSFGQTLHHTLQKFFQLVIDRSKGVQADLFSSKTTAVKEKKNNKSKAPASLKDLMAIYQEVWQDDWFDSEREKTEYRAKGERILKEFYQQIMANFPVPLFLEKGFNLKIGDYTLRGVIDRVDSLTADKWKVMDYKTGKVKDKLTFEDKKQLLLYHLAGQEVFKSQVGALAFYYLDENKEVSFEATAEDLEKVKTWVIETADKIKESKFQATPGWQCKTCDYNQICPFADK